MATRRKAPKQPSAPAAAAQDDSDDLVSIARGLAAAVSEHNLTELVIETPDVTFTVRRGAPMVAVPAAMPVAAPMLAAAPAAPAVAAPPAAAPAAPAAPVVDEKVHIVKSPFVGTFYRKPNPDSPEYVKVNDKVGKGQVLCIIEAMKLMNEIESDLAGTLVAVLAENGAPVEFDQPLFKIALP